MSRYRELYKELKEVLPFYKRTSQIAIEVCLYVIHSIGEDIEAKEGWSVFNKYYLRLSEKRVTAEHQRWLYMVRKYWHSYGSRFYWNRDLDDYMTHMERERIFTIEEGHIRINPSCQVSVERFLLFRNFLNSLPDEEEIKKEVYCEKIFYRNQEAFELNVESSSDELATLPAYREKKIYTIRQDKDWNMILAEMGGIFSHRPSIQLEILDGDELKLDGLRHVVGTLGSGKSTLKQALIYDAVKNEHLKIAVVENSISKLLELWMLLKQCGIQAIPFISTSSEEIYLREYLAACRGIREIKNSDEIAILSGNCILKAVAGDETEKYPCNRLLNEQSVPVVCPFFGACGHQFRIRELIDADVILITPQAIARSKVEKPIDNYNQSMYELLYDLMDLIIVDEADDIQQDFERSLMVTEHINREQESILVEIEKLYKKVEGCSVIKNDLYNFKQDFERMKSHLTLMERIFIKYHDIIEHYNNKNILINGLRDKVLKGFSYEKVLIDGKETSFEKLLLEYVKLTEGMYGITEEQLSNEIKTMLDFLFDFHWTGSYAEKKIEENSLVLLKRYGVTYASDIKNKELQFQRYILLMLLVPFDVMLKRLVRLYSSVYFEMEGYSKSVRMFAGIREQMRHLVTEPCFGMLLGYKLEFKDHLLYIDALRYVGVGREMLLNWSGAKEELGKKGPGILCLSGTSLAPKSAHYHIAKKPDAILYGKPEGKIYMKFKPLADGKSYIRISGTNERQRKENLKKMIDKLADTLRACLSKSQYRKIMIICGSYQEAEAVCAKLRYHNFNAYFVNEDGAEKKNYMVYRKDIERFPVLSNYADILVVPLIVISRGFNILDEDGNSYFGTEFYLARPYMVPGNYANEIQMIHYQLDKIIDAVKKENKDYQNRMLAFRKACFAKFIHVTNITYWKSLNEEDREIMTWFILIQMKQAIGRLQRNGNESFVFLCDSAFCDGLQKQGTELSPSTSTIHSMEFLLESIMEDKATKILYQNFYEAICEMNREAERIYCNLQEEDE